MEREILENNSAESNKITTIKLSNETKLRLDNLKLYNRETYEEIMKRALEILNLARISPERARAKLIMLDKQKRQLRVNGISNIKDLKKNISKWLIVGKFRKYMMFDD